MHVNTTLKKLKLTIFGMHKNFLVAERSRKMYPIHKEMPIETEPELSK